MQRVVLLAACAWGGQCPTLGGNANVPLAQAYLKKASQLVKCQGNGKRGSDYGASVGGNFGQSHDQVD